MTNKPVSEERILVLAPKGRDAPVIQQVLARGGAQCAICADYDELVQQMQLPAAAALIVEEALYNVDLQPLLALLVQQPSWSDFPLIILTSQSVGKDEMLAHSVVRQLGNVVMLERPFNAETLRSAARSALRARRRQYQARSDLQERADLNATLEIRIAERTAELAQANDRLMREMRERERAQTALVQTHKMEALGHLTSGISHDFNNLLCIIQGNAELVRHLTSDEQITRIADTICKAAQQGAKVTSQLLAFSRGQPLNLKACDLNQGLEGIRELLKASLGAGIEVRLELAPALPYARADLNQIELAILNLAINAKDAMRGSGTITIRTETRVAAADLVDGEDYVVVSVIDTGTGINPEILGKVFDPFFTTKPVGKGTGLGLSQVYGIAQQSGGTAKIASQVGLGTTVEIWLPVADLQAMPEPVPRGDFSPCGEGKRASILVVEDEPQVREFMVESLEILGYQVFKAEDAQSGIDRLAKECPDLLITDFLMPGEMNGAELIKHAHALYPGLPAIVATGYADLEAIDEAIDRAMILPKPFQLTDLANKVHAALMRPDLDAGLVNAA
jgi:signal transduction histidine kinase/ActR/RegA family two-component response regulator